MKPGRELDALIAEKVMGHTDIGSGWECPNYSTDISAAWEVLEKIKSKNTKLEWESYSKQWYCYDWHEDYFPDEDKFAHADTAPHAICLAALKACGVEI